MSSPIDRNNEKIDLQKLYADARKKWYVESGQKAKDDKALYDALVAPLIDRSEK